MFRGELTLPEWNAPAGLCLRFGASFFSCTGPEGLRKLRLDLAWDRIHGFEK